MITLILHVFTITGRRWKIGGKHITVNNNHVQGALDEAARILYTKEVGTQLTTGGLIFEKTKKGYDVYAHVGSYT